MKCKNNQPKTRRLVKYDKKRLNEWATYVEHFRSVVAAGCRWPPTPVTHAPPLLTTPLAPEEGVVVTVTLTWVVRLQLCHHL